MTTTTPGAISGGLALRQADAPWHPVPWMRSSLLSSHTHPAAEVNAATVVRMPDDRGGVRMAIRLEQLARAGLTPDWMPGVVPRCGPVDTRENQNGVRAVIAVVGTELVFSRGKWRIVDILARPVTWMPHIRSRSHRPGAPVTTGGMRLGGGTTGSSRAACSGA